MKFEFVKIENIGDFSRQIQYWRLLWYLVYTCEVLHHANSCMWRRKRTRTLLDFNLVKKRKFYEKQVENDQKSGIRVRCVSCFVGPPSTFWASLATLNLFDNPAWYRVFHGLATLSLLPSRKYKKQFWAIVKES